MALPIITGAKVASLFKQYWWVALLIAIFLYALVELVNFVDDFGDDMEDKGATKERSTQQERTIENVEKANEAEQDITRPNRGNAARYAQCLRSARTPENCKRFMPDVQED